jgi:hypothetical protein
MICVPNPHPRSQPTRSKAVFVATPSRQLPCHALLRRAPAALTGRFVMVAAAQSGSSRRFPAPPRRSLNRSLPGRSLHRPRMAGCACPPSAAGTIGRKKIRCALAASRDCRLRPKGLSASAFGGARSSPPGSLLRSSHPHPTATTTAALTAAALRLAPHF